MALIHRWPLTSGPEDVVGGLNLTNNGGVTFDYAGGQFSGANWLTCTKVWPSVFCLTGWFKNNTATGYILGACDSGYYYGFGIYNDVANNCFLLQAHGGTYNISSGVGLDTDWHFFAIRGYPSGSNTWQFWFDGISRGSVTCSFSLNTSFSLGHYGVGTNPAYNWGGGRIADARLYDHALSQAEVDALYVAGPNGNAPVVDLSRPPLPAVLSTCLPASLARGFR